MKKQVDASSYTTSRDTTPLRLAGLDVRGGCGDLNSRDKWIFRVTAA